MPKKSRTKKSQTAEDAAPADGGPKKKEREEKEEKLTFRLKDRVLARKLDYVLTHRNIFAWQFIEPLIRDDVEVAFADVKRDVANLGGGGGPAEAKKAE